MKIVNKKDAVSRYNNLLKFESKRNDNLTYDVENLDDFKISDLPLIYTLLYFIENDRFINSLVLDEDKNKVKMNIYGEPSNAMSEKIVVSLFKDKINNAYGQIEHLIRLEFDSKYVNEMIIETLKERYKIKFYSIEVCYYQDVNELKETLHLERNSISYTNNAVDIEKTHVKKQKEMKLKIEDAARAGLAIERDFEEERSFSKKEILDNFFKDDNCRKRNLDLANDFDQEIKFFRDNFQKYHKLMKEFEMVFFDSDLQFKDDFIFNDTKIVQFETGIAKPYDVFTFDLCLNDDFESLKSKQLYQENAITKVESITLRDWIENREETKSIIRLFNY